MKMKLKKGQIILLAVVLFLAAVFAGCQAVKPAVDQAPDSKPEQQTDSKAEQDTGSKAEEKIEPAKIKIVLPAGADEEKYVTQEIDKFMEKNPDVKVEAMFTPNDASQYGNSIQLMFASNEPPDIFRTSGSLPTKMTLSYEKGWLAPLDQFVTDEFVSRFPEGYFEKDGGLYINGKLYGIPFIENKFTAFRPFIYNMGILEKYGFSKLPETWSEFRDMAAKITSEGNGEVYGFAIAGGSSPQTSIVSFAETAVSHIVDAHLTEGNIVFDVKTGKSAAANEGYIAAVNFFKDLHDSKIMAPGWESCNDQLLIQQFASEKVAIIGGQAWFYKEILALNPDIKIAASPAPVPDSGRKGYKYVYAATEPYFGLSSSSANLEAAWKLIDFFSTPEHQEGFFRTQGRVTVLWKSYADTGMPEYMSKNMKMADEYLRVAPYPGFMHPDGEDLLSRITSKAPKPVLKELYVAAIIGNTSYENLAAEYDEKMDKIIDEQIAEMRSSGSDITRDILIYPADWDPTKNYTYSK